MTIYYLVFLLMPALLAEPPAALPESPEMNQLQNGSFARGFLGWDVSAWKNTAVVLGGREGKLCGKMWNAPNENHFLFARQTVNLEGKEASTAVFKCDLRCDQVKASGWQKLLLRVYFRDKANQNLSTLDISQDGTFDWKEIASTGNIPANATSAMVEFNLFQQPGTAWFDHVRLYLYKADGSPIPGIPPGKEKTPVTAGDGWVWWEGEHAAETNAVPSTYWLELDHEGLSGRRWWNSQQEQTEDNPLFASYQIEVPQDGRFQFWVRDVWQRNTVRYRFGEGEWRVASYVGRVDELSLAQYRGANWGYWGEVELKKGPHLFEIRPEPFNSNIVVKDGKQVVEKSHYIALDCFLLISGRFRPMGKYKPGHVFTPDYETPTVPEGRMSRPQGERKFIPLSLKSIANRGFEDEVAGDGKGGWSDQGPTNSLPGFPTGRQTMAEAVFEILDPAQNEGKSCVVLLSNHSSSCPETVVVDKISSSARSIYFLHAAAWTRAGEALAEYRVRYTDGKEEVVPIRDGREVLNWWGPQDASLLRVGWRGRNPSSTSIGVCVYAWENPHPEKTIQSITFASLKTEAIPILIGISLCDTPGYLPDSESLFIPKSPPKKEDLYCFVPQPDDFGPAEMDLSFLNDKPAGKHGFLRRDGERLVFEDGTEARFWGTGEDFTPSHADAELLAKRLAKYGINCVRFHSLMGLADETRDDTRHLDAVKMDRLDTLVARLKEQGIYVYFALTYPHFKGFKKGDGLPQEIPSGAGGAGFFNAEVIREHWGHFQRVLTHKNPYTGNAYVDEPALAFVEIYNEDSIFFYSTDQLPSVYWKELEIRFNAWLQMRYGHREGLSAAWQIPGMPPALDNDERLDPYSVRLLKTWDYGDRWEAHRRNRCRDQATFYYELESGFYRRTRELFRQWGLRSPVVTSNWRGARRTQYAYLLGATGGDVIDNHSYYASGDTGKPFHPIPMSRMANGGCLPALAFNSLYDYPSICTEWDAGPPHEYPYETVIMTASAGCMQGMDGLFQFVGFNNDWSGKLRLSPYFTTGLQNPNVQLIHPACALLFRRGDVQQAPSIFELRATKPQVLEGAFDRDDLPLPAAALAAGRVGVRFGDEPQPHLVGDFKKHVDETAGSVHSLTGEIRWNYRKGLWVIDAPRSQGIVGEIDGENATRDVQFHLESPYGAVLVSSMTDQPIASSEKVLISLTARNLNNGSRYNVERNILEKDGDYPVLLERLRGRITLRCSRARVLVLECDPNGKVLKSRQAEPQNERLALELPAESLATYVIVKEAGSSR